MALLSFEARIYVINELRQVNRIGFPNISNYEEVKHKYFHDYITMGNISKELNHNFDADERC